MNSRKQSKRRLFRGHPESIESLSGLLKKPPGEGTGPTILSESRGILVGRVPSRGEQCVVQQTVSPRIRRRGPILVHCTSLQQNSRSLPKFLDRLRSLRFLLLKLVNIRAIRDFPISFIRVHQCSSVVRFPALTRLLISCSTGLLSGCSRAPTFDIVGSFFPAWLVCLIAGIFLASFAHWLLSRLKIALLVPILVYPSLAALFTFLLWLAFFS